MHAPRLILWLLAAVLTLGPAFARAQEASTPTAPSEDAGYDPSEDYLRALEEAEGEGAAPAEEPAAPAAEPRSAEPEAAPPQENTPAEPPPAEPAPEPQAPAAAPEPTPAPAPASTSPAEGSPPSDAPSEGGFTPSEEMLRALEEAEGAETQAAPAPAAAPAGRPAQKPSEAQMKALESALAEQSTKTADGSVGDEGGEKDKKDDAPRANISGMVLMPTAYRGTGRDDFVGLGLDINAAYYIGRLYGKNDLPWTLAKTNFIDRIGLWMLTADAKIVVQSEGEWRPAMAVGGMGTFAFRDSAQPQLNQPTATVQVEGNKTQRFAGAYLVFSKRLPKKFVWNIGYLQGSTPNAVPLLTEFLTPAALQLSGYPAGTKAEAQEMIFGGIMFQPKPDQMFAIEIMEPQGMAGNPLLINLQLGTLLRLNFQLSYLRFDGGWDLLGMFQFRYSQYPKR